MCLHWTHCAFACVVSCFRFWQGVMKTCDPFVLLAFKRALVVGLSIFKSLILYDFCTVIHVGLAGLRCRCILWAEMTNKMYYNWSLFLFVVIIEPMWWWTTPRWSLRWEKPPMMTPGDHQDSWWVKFLGKVYCLFHLCFTEKHPL